MKKRGISLLVSSSCLALVLTALPFIASCAPSAPAPTPQPTQPLVSEEVELKYDDGGEESSFSVGRWSGFLVHFSPPAIPFVISKVKVFASLQGRGYEDQTTWFEIWDQNFDLLYYWQKSATTFSSKPSWVTVEIPSIPVNDDFYIVFYPCSQKEGGVYLHCDLSQINNHSKMAKAGGSITDWPWDLPEEKSNWMIRVVGRPTDEVEAVSLPPFQIIEGSAEFQETVSRLDNPEKLSQWMIDNISSESHYERWKETGVNYIAPPDQTFESEVGSCAEFAAFASYVLQHHKYQAEILQIKVESDPSKNHAVCVYHSSGFLYIIDLGRIKGPYQGYEDIAFSHHKDWSGYQIYNSWDKYQKMGPPSLVVSRS